MECLCYLRGEPFSGPIIPFATEVEHHPISTKDQARLHQFGKKVLQGIFMDYALHAEGSLKRELHVTNKALVPKEENITFSHVQAVP